MLARLKPYAVIWGSCFVGVGGVSLFILSDLPDYIPSDALSAAASSPTDLPSIQSRMMTVLDDCMGLRHLEAEDLGTRLTRIYSFENDVGLLARTTILCRASSCVVSATALFAGTRFAPTCRRHHSRRRRLR